MRLCDRPYFRFLFYCEQINNNKTRYQGRRFANCRFLLRSPVKQLQGGRKFYFKVVAHSRSAHAESETVLYEVPEHVQQKAITAALVGGLLLLIVSIILSICTVKICNKRKRRKQEKGQSRGGCC